MKSQASTVRSGVVAGAWAAGLAVWWQLLEFGHIPFGARDWYQESMRTGVFREALLAGRIPLHWQVEGRAPERMFGILDLIVSPLLPALPWLSDAAHVTLHALLMYSVGVAGVAWLARRRGWSSAAFIAGWLLFTLNGHLTAHVSVGHLMWTAEFLLPWFLGWCADWVERGPSPGLAARLALLLAAMAFLGGFHLCVWCAIFLLLLSATRPGARVPAGIALGLAVLITAVRWIPAWFQYGRLGMIRAEGFPGLAGLTGSLVWLRDPSSTVVPGIGAWELDTFIGVAGVALLAAGVARRRWPPRWLVPVVGMAVLSYGDVYTTLLSPWPGFCAESVVTRLLILPVLALAIPAGDALTRHWRAGRARRGLIVAALAVLAIDVGRHAWAWRVGVHPQGTPPATRLFIGSDPSFQRAIAVGAGISLAGLAAALWYLRRAGPSRRSRRG